MSTTRQRSVIIVFCFVLIASLMQSGGVTGAFVGGDDGLDANCIVHPIHIRGQAHTGLAGVEGGTGQDLKDALALDQTAYDSVGGAGAVYAGVTANKVEADPGWPADYIAPLGYGREPVVILVIDDFSYEGAHGFLVLEVLEKARMALREATGIRNIFLEPVNIAEEGEYRSDLIVPAIEKRVLDGQYRNNIIEAVVAARGRNIIRFVLNMSFALVPCADEEIGYNLLTDFYPNFQEEPTYSLLEYLEDVTYVDGEPQPLGKGSIVLELLRDPRGTDDFEGGYDIEQQEQSAVPSKSDLYARLQPDEGLDALRELILILNQLSEPSDFAVVAVAAAGNEGQDMPFFPAGWPEVVSVSASVGQGYAVGKWVLSNNGEIMAPGAWYRFDDQNYRAGTSFAAPITSLLAAVYLTYRDIPCTFPPDIPPMASPGMFDNKAFLDAAGIACLN